MRHAPEQITGESVGKHPAARCPVGQRALGERRTQETVAVIIETAPTSRAVLHLGRVLAKGKGLSAVQLGTLLDLAQAALAGELVAIGIHLHIVLGEAQGAVLGKEGAVSAVQNVHVGICEVGVGIDIDGAVVCTNVAGHDRSAVCRVFTVQNKSSAGLGRAEELTSKLLLIIVVDGAIDVPALVLVLEAAIDDHDVVKAVVELSVQKFEEGALVDARHFVRLILGDEVRKLQSGRTFEVTDGLKGCICRYLCLLFGHHIRRVLKHTQ